MKVILLAITAMLATSIAFAQVTLLPLGSSWKYLDNGTNQGTAWRGIIFNDGAWKTGNAQLGYGDGDEATVVSFGTNAKKKYLTTYFRKAVSISNPAQFTNISLCLKRDDGAVVYINGTERFRSNMPTGTISSTTRASTAAADDGNTLQTINLSSAFFANGNNTIAVEVHQFSATDPDLSFDLQLLGNANQPPIANAGVDQIITLPVSSVTLSGSASSDPDGTITSYAWTQTSGPNTATITTPGNVSTTVSGLVQGSYSFQLTVTDNSGATASDVVGVTVNAATGNLIVFSYGGVWKYFDNGTDQGTAWRNVGFNDVSWASGPGQLGYGDGDEATVVSYGPSSTAKYITTYFRKVVNISLPASYSYFNVGVKRDDGIVMYVNGTEVWRNTMPTGTISYTTLATAAVSDDGGTIQTTTIPSSAFVSGNNTIAVEIHQNAGSSSDISFDMELVGVVPGALVLTRGPYLQMGSGTAATLRWRSDVASDSKIEVGTVHGTYTLSAVNPTVTTEHEVRITGLSPDTKYFYRFGSSTYTLQAGTDNYFITAPPASTTRKIRVSVFGDCGRNDNGYQTGSLNSYRNYVGSNPAELMLLLGDNAYNAGTDAEYTSGFFAPYQGNILKNHMLFPTPGNHDYANTSARQIDKNVPYYNIFTMPTAAECGGVASGTEAYYSYDWGPIHFLSLDSYGMETSNNWRLYDTTSPQVTWLKQDLAANSKKWTVAYWHHPPYTMGSHNSDTETELVRIRERFIRILERYGVDMIMCGHSHDYERSYLLKDYFGNESTFNLATHAVSNSSGKYNGTANSCPYNTESGQVNHGTVYIVSGSAGASGGVQSGYPHNAMPFSQNDGGMFYFEVEDNRLDAKWIRKDGVIADQFTMVKDAAKTSNISMSSGQSVTLTASWIGSYQWSNGATTRRITVSPASTTTYTCTDGSAACLTDNFNVNVTTGDAITLNSMQNLQAGKDQIKVFPIPVFRGEVLTITAGGHLPVDVTFVDEAGRVVHRARINGRMQLATETLRPGLYLVRKTGAGGSQVAKFVVTAR